MLHVLHLVTDNLSKKIQNRFQQHVNVWADTIEKDVHIASTWEILPMEEIKENCFLKE